jgi:hypothetical protein
MHATVSHHKIMSAGQGSRELSAAPPYDLVVATPPPAPRIRPLSLRKIWFSVKLLLFLSKII